jgi:quinol monooxygenase YgiN
MAYVVLAEFLLKSDSIEIFLTCMTKHAILSRAEPGCQLFEIAQDADDARCVVLYERYADEAAYVAHRATAHYARFREWGPPLIEPKDGQLFQRRSVLRHVC